MNVEELADRLAIEALMYRFAEGIDECDFEMYRSVFTDEIELDYSSYRPGTIGTWQADKWVDRGRALFPGLDATSHSISSIRIAIDGDTATVKGYVRADHVLRGHPTGEVFTVAGEYRDTLVRTADGWKIAAKKLIVRWQEGDPSLMLVAVERVANGTPVRG
jgi:3-phenylpropionate/cinnamic acid dioxygenase small subunit